MLARMQARVLAQQAAVDPAPQVLTLRKAPSMVAFSIQAFVQPVAELAGPIVRLSRCAA
ncbi:hypothetical protein PBS_20020 [Paraburkholderia sp. 2C]